MAHKAYQHICDTEDPQRPCCWAARSAEFDILKNNDSARIAKYGALSCKDCGKIYRVVEGVVEDHTCAPLAERGFIARGLD